MRRIIGGYQDLTVWQRAMQIAELTYLVTKTFPREELFGLTSQARRAAGSVPANIAEGYGRGTRPAYVSFLRIAQGSLKELETHMLLAARLGFVRDDSSHADLLQHADELGRMLRRLIERFTKP